MIGLSRHMFEGISPTAASRVRTIEVSAAHPGPLLSPTSQFHCPRPTSQSHCPRPTTQSHHTVTPPRPTTQSHHPSPPPSQHLGPPRPFPGHPYTLWLVSPLTHVPTHPHSPMHPRNHETKTHNCYYWRPCTQTFGKRNVTTLDNL